MKISIIIPIYNVEDYIIECLQSVANQTMAEGVECILIDDCGTDNSMGLATDFITNYQGTIKFTMLHHNHNRGLSAARNTGIKAAKGDYVYFLDSDDTIDTNCMEIMYSYIYKYGLIDLVQSSSYKNEDEHITCNPYNLSEYITDKKTIKHVLLTFNGDLVGAQGRLINKYFLLNNGLFFKEGIIHEDNYWTFFLAKHVSKMSFCPKRTYYHRYNPNSITGNVNITKEIDAFKTIINDLCHNVDVFLKGRQKEYILCNLIVALDNHYYESEEQKKKIIETFLKVNTRGERGVFYLYLHTCFPPLKSKLLHILLRIYKIND